MSSIVPCRGTYATVLLYVPAVLEIIFELHGFVYLGKHMSFWYFAEGTSRGSGAFSRQKFASKVFWHFVKNLEKTKRHSI